MKANKAEAMRQIRGALRRFQKQAARIKTEKDMATALAMWEGYLQVFYFSGIISREEYNNLKKETEAFRRPDAYQGGLKRDA